MKELGKERSLYEQDILLWVEDTVTKLKAGDFQNLDIENLIEEVESLGISQKRELSSRLLVLLEHLLKRLYVPLSENYRGWEKTIRNQRNGLELLFQDAPSLKNQWHTSFDNAWRIALKTVRKEYPQVTFPEQWQYPSDLETMLNLDFWEEES
ncbi:DUF29 domain-containing protein [Anabaena cylindrica FACHB-243]|nr:MULTISPECIES: DUF29 domain-containing protein [Anabaena]MBD2419435.1 DUF29 domain-containing protein [Anabaena cylindrica FACHB-243]MBY5283870.1 DUF29 domain-containing protein [Anabaena sp. CCAP 1446/1C]MBY5308792.1 DUF29 domain-containing protein [Anabaena sp. CCAP 1446/1C]MCM2408942.1 DUF29 domain-containing protein [Anabaena sp. CCAP 1446/1C]